MSGIEYYAGLLDNQTRLDGFRKGIQAAVHPGDRVLDLGTGLGTYAFFAARAGAGRVWAVDRSPIVHVAEELARANNLADRIEFLRGEVPGVELPGDLDVIVFEDFPVCFMNRPIHRLLTHVVRHCLKPSGRIVPGRARLSLAPVTAEGIRRTLFPLGDRDGDWMGLGWEALRPYLGNTPRKADLRPGQLLGRPAQGPIVPLLPVPRATALGVEGAWRAATAGAVGALAVWFDLEVVPAGWISNEPRERAEPWGQWLLPVDPPLDVEPGDTVRGCVAAEELEGGAPGWLRWEVGNGERIRRGHEFAGLPLGLQDLEPGTDTGEA